MWFFAYQESKLTKMRTKSINQLDFQLCILYRQCIGQLPKCHKESKSNNSASFYDVVSQGTCKLQELKLLFSHCVSPSLRPLGLSSGLLVNLPLSCLYNGYVPHCLLKSMLLVVAFVFLLLTPGIMYFCCVCFELNTHM